MLRIGVLVSGGGTNLQALMDYLEQHEVDAEIVTVVSNNENAYALKRCQIHKIPTFYLSPKQFSNREEFNQQLKEHFRQCQVDLIVMAGYLVVVGSSFIQAFQGRIINIHPSLIPAFCGEGYYGLKVHEEVLKRGVKITGATVHIVDEGTDTGPIIMQKAVEVKEDDTPEVLQQRVMKEAEWILLPKVVQLFSENKIHIKNNKVSIDNNIERVLKGGNV